MTLKCTEGHAISPETNLCEEGHPVDPNDAESATSPTPIVLTAEQLKDIIHSSIQGALAAHASNSSHIHATANIKKPDRPTIDLGGNESQWAFFLSEWTDYKKRCKLTATDDILSELKQCCSMDLRKELFDFVGPTTFAAMNENEMLIKMQSLAIKGKNKAVHRQEFYSMHQDHGQPIQAYVAKLRSKSENCKFTFKCSSAACGNQVNSYAESMVEDQMVVGCVDQTIQEETLARDAELKTFQAKFDLIQALEEGRRAKSQLMSDSTVAAQSQYKMNKQPSRKSSTMPATTPNNSVCQGCGQNDHGPGTALPRSQHCPARDKECEFCLKKGHLISICRQKLSSKPSKSSHSLLSDMASNFYAYNGPLMHMEWSIDKHCFETKSPKRPPHITIQVAVMADEHAKYGKAIPSPIISSLRQDQPVLACSDTGAQTCASGIDILQLLNLSEKYLIPTKHRIHSVTQSPMSISGILLLKLKAKERTTNQVVYVSNNIQGFFISELAQLDLGILPQSYPKPDNFLGNSMAAASVSGTNHVSCGCRPRTTPPAKPEKLPFAPTTENREHLEAWFLEYFASSAFNTCEHQLLPKMNGPPLDIHFHKDATPKAFHCPIPVPHHWKKQVKEDLDRDVCLGIIEKVPPGTPTVWCSKMVVVPKKDGSPRRTVDLQHLNAATYRETHHTPSPFNQASVVPPNTKKTVLDAWNGYHSLALAQNARNATTFITEWGRYRYLSSPQGFHAAGDGYTRAFDNITVDVPRMAKCIDDSVLWDQSIENAFWHTFDFITTCHKGGVIFNPKKFKFANDEVDFAGFTLTQNGIKPMKQILCAIRDFPTPTNITGARSWFGLVNQVAYAFSMADEMQPFRDLLKSSTPWYWDSTLDEIFTKSKDRILQLVDKGVRSFELNRTTCLSTDWSKHGIGYILSQKHCDCPIADAPKCCKEGWRLIFAGSRFTTDTESRYAPVEGEALAVVNGLEKCRMFVLGCPDLIVAVDHKPLVKILGDRKLEDIKNPRLFNLKEKTLMYSFRIKHIAGACHLGPDACSRYPAPPSGLSHLSSLCQPPSKDDNGSAIMTNNFVESYVLAAMSGAGYTDGIDIQAITWNRVKEAATSDTEIQSLNKVIMNGFPAAKHMLCPSLHSYWNVRQNLSCIEGVPLYNNRIVVPKNLRGEVLDSLHSAHQGVNGMKARARASVFWPGITAAITSRRASCKTCDTIAPSQPAEPLIYDEAPQYPFEQVVTDFFHLHGFNYLAYADRYTGWVSIIKCAPGDGNSNSLKKHLRLLFGVYGVPQVLSTDGGPPFNSHSIQQFLKQWGVNSRLSSAYYAQSNGRAELAVKTAKRILMDNIGANGDIDSDAVTRALLQHRNTPVQDVGLSPAQLLYGRILKDTMPTLKDAHKLRPEWQLVAHQREEALAKKNIISMERYNMHTKNLPELQLGNTVIVQNQTGPRRNKWDKTGVIVECGNNRQYTVRMHGSGRCTLRNRRFLRRIEPVSADRPLCLPHRHAPSSVPQQNVTNVRHTPTPVPQLELENVHDTPPVPQCDVTYENPEPQVVDEPPHHADTPTSVDVPRQNQLSTDSPHQLTVSKDTNTVVPTVDAAPTTSLPVSNPPQGNRQSSRARKPKRMLSPSLRGKYHNYSTSS